MKQNKKGLKNRILKSLIGIGRKCKILAYPITFFVIAFLAVYHAVRKLFVESEYRKVRTGLLGVLCAAVVIGAVVVLPTLANETGEEPSTEGGHSHIITGSHRVEVDLGDAAGNGRTGCDRRAGDAGTDRTNQTGRKGRRGRAGGEADGRSERR